MRILLIVLIFFASISSAIGANSASNPLLVLCYHSIFEKVDKTDLSYFGTSPNTFVEHLEYLQKNNYTIVSLQQVLDAREGREPLPPKSVLLTFDDGYLSFYSFVYPILRRFGYPSVLAIVGSWTDGNAPFSLPEPLMTWPQIKEVADSGLVEIASHSFALHQGIPINPQINFGPPASFIGYLPAEQRYETEEEYRNRLVADFSAQKALFQRKIGRIPRIMVWPYGRYSMIGTEVARNHGIQITFNLDENDIVEHPLNGPKGLNRLIVHNQPVDIFAYFISNLDIRHSSIRAAQVDIDRIYEPGNPQQTEKNLGYLIERMLAMGVNTVFVQAFADQDGDGIAKSVYFHTNSFPVEADIFSHVVDRIKARGMDVYAWMPTLALQFPDEQFNRAYSTQQQMTPDVQNSLSGYLRLTPFAPEVRQRVAALYRDMAANSNINGVLFQDDTPPGRRLTPHSLALKSFSRVVGHPVTANEIFDNPDLFEQWRTFSSAALNRYCNELKEAVHRYRPDALFARNVYASSVLQPEAEQNFAAVYQQSLENDDFTVVMAYPQMAQIKNPCKWLKNLTQMALNTPGAREKVIFKLQAEDWKTGTPVAGDLLYREMRSVLASFGKHLAYYPDSFRNNTPEIEQVSLEMSSRELPE
ncbi:MAG: poly-beta-1,6-N-acetyl-D-glucosamine N-deacetylase PgaB [Deltaproteobacteria bacterium]|nr:MAG: poly-beta-1,6-N-acetyl-D-glucosamine N-deacetylase PgaB [Deltaproteobacteria bacterium]